MSKKVSGILKQLHDIAQRSSSKYFTLKIRNCKQINVGGDCIHVRNVFRSLFDISLKTLMISREEEEISQELAR